MKNMPTLFISHGPPWVLLMKNTYTEFMKQLGQKLPKPKGILCVSAHWEATHPTFTSNFLPEIIYDFSGPPQLFNQTYPAQGSAGLSERGTNLLLSHGIKSAVHEERGLDHGAWVPLKRLFPDADIPVVQLSVQTEKDAQHHFDMGRALRPLREEGILIMGSGGAVHNLDEVQNYGLDDPPPEYVLSFDQWLEDAITKNKNETLINYQRTSPAPRQCHPYPSEHFLPLFVCLGANHSHGTGQKIHEGFMYGTLSMAAYRWDEYRTSKNR